VRIKRLQGKQPHSEMEEREITNDSAALEKGKPNVYRLENQENRTLIML
jgi:hypothetical protein